MNTYPLTRILAVLLIVLFTVPATLFVAPQRASADAGGCIGGILFGGAGSLVSKISSVPVSNLPIETTSGITSGATTGSCVYDVIVVPILRQMIRGFLQQMTMATISWINGSNPTGQPSYVPNLSLHLQGVGDAVALSFISRAATAFNSPFGSAISFSLQNSYAQQSSMAGFYAANRSTLAQSSPDINGFLSGDWSKGGLASWFALTTQTQNNPYTLYYAAQNQLGSNINQAQTNRRQDLIQSKGFLSYCGGDTTTKVNVGLGGSSINPQVSCFNSDGTQANATTPGSTIASYLEANVNSGVGQLVAAQDLDAALGQIVMALGNQILGPGGLFGATQPSSSSNTTPVSTTPSNATASSISLADSKLSDVAAYTSAWATIAAAANIASTSVASLASFCLAETKSEVGSERTQQFIDAANAQIVAAQNAITTLIAPVLAQAQSVPNANASTTAFALKVKAAGSVVPIADPTQYGIDVSTLATLPPMTTDVAVAQQAAQVTGGAQANPGGSLSIFGGTVVDQMNLLSTNSATLKTTVCNPNSSLYWINANNLNGG
jgi:hypothetical protein